MNRLSIARKRALPFALHTAIASAADERPTASANALDLHQALQFLLGRQP